MQFSAGGGSIRDAKVVMLGSQTVGKSSIVTRLIRGTFTVETVSTIGAVFQSKTVIVGDIQVKLQIWDTGGSERYRSMAPMYFRDADAAIVVYDMTSVQSFQELEGWLKGLSEQGPESIVVALAGNKCDLTGSRAVSKAMAQRFVADNGIPIYLETSALSGENVEDIFTKVAALVLTGGTVLGPKKQTVNVDGPREQSTCC
jgi:small GTP-binding protein